MVTYTTHPQIINQIFKLINSGKFYSLTFIKKGDGEIRYLNGHRAIYKKPDGSEEEVPAARYDPKDHNIIRVWDRNALDYKTKIPGAYRAAIADRILYIKSGNNIIDLVEENDIMNRFNLTYEDIEGIKNKMKMNEEEEQSGHLINEGNRIYGIKELGQEISETMGGDAYTYSLILSRSFKHSGDEGVIDTHKQMTGIILENMSKGKYRFI